MGYNPRKAAQTIAYLAIKNSKKPLDVLKAVKLVYLADRLSIQNYGFPIQDEYRASMKHGPVNLDTYSYIQGERSTSGGDWTIYLRDREDHKVALADRTVDCDDLDELSDADIETLDKVWSVFGNMEKWDLVQWTHKPENVPEWEDPNGSSSRIPIGRLLSILGVENAAEHAEQLYEIERTDDSFNSYSS